MMREPGCLHVLFADGAAASRAGDPAQGPELRAEGRDEVGRVVRVARSHELVGILDTVGGSHDARCVRFGGAG